jgi:hypothetical protein
MVLWRRHLVTKHAHIVNLSLGSPDGPGTDPIEDAVNRLSADYGALFVIAAGNNGRSRDGTGTLDSPGSAEAALAVGAVDRDDGLAAFSSRGPRIGDFGVKPEITAPGVGIVAARAALERPAIGEPVGTAYQRLSGTSMATPHVAGASGPATGTPGVDRRAAQGDAGCVGQPEPEPDRVRARRRACRRDARDRPGHRRRPGNRGIRRGQLPARR